LDHNDKPEETMLNALRHIAAIALVALAALPAAAQYPSKPIRMIVPFPSGSATDTVARILAAPLSQALGQPVIVEDKPGADGAIAGELVAKSAPDGYTLLMATNSPLAAVPLLRKNPPYDPIADFTPISFVGRYTFYLLVNASVPAKTLTELLDYARANPDKLNYATGNTTGIVSTGQLLALGGVKMVHVPYKGEPAAITDLVGGRVHVMFATPTTGLAFIKEGKLRALATTNAKRTAQLPDVPTMAEAGMPRFSIGTWAALFGPAKMPRDILDRLNHEVNAAMKRPDVREQLERQAFEYAPSTPEEMGAFLKDQIEVWSRAIRESGIKPE
jgi:tripartite-type tricarboxylate transporter receptor subunit TctC